MLNVFIAIDATSAAKDIALAGKELTIQYPHASITFLHVLLKPDYYTSAQYAPILGFSEHYNKGLSDVFDGDNLDVAVNDFLESLKEDLDIPNAHIMVVEGDAAETILNVCAENKADMLVIGKQNKSTKDKSRIGRVTEGVLKKSDFPVLVVPV